MPIRRSLPTLMLALACSCFGAGSSSAHVVVVDGSAAEWTLAAPPFANMGRLSRNASDQGEYVWLDASGDQRTDLGPDQSADLVSVRVTGDPTHLSFLVTLTDLGESSGFTPMVQVSIDTDGVPGSGQSFLGGFADTRVASSSQWEYILMTRFESGASVSTFNSSFVEVGSDPAALDVANDVIEFSIPWARLGMTGPPQHSLRMTVSTYGAVSPGTTVDIGGTSTSNAIDALGDCGDPRRASYPNAFACDLSDAVLDGAFDVWFGSDGEPVSPLLISEVLYDVASGSEWIEMRNVSGGPVSLDGFKLGDEETPDPLFGIEAMSAFPSGTSLPAGGSLTVAASASLFAATYGFSPDAEFQSTDGAVPDMVPYGAWFTGAAAAMTLANAGDEVLLLDRWNTVLDVLVYGTGAYGGVTAHAVIPQGHSLERVPAAQDRDDCAVDFQDRAVPDPANSTVAVEESPRAGFSISLPSPNPAHGDVRWSLRLPGRAWVVASIHDVGGRHVRSIVDGALGAGEHVLRWDRRDETGTLVPGGLYFLRVESGDRRLTGRVVQVN